MAGSNGTTGTTGTDGESYFTNWTIADASILEDDGSFVLLAHSDIGKPYTLLRVDPTGRQVASAPSLSFSQASGLTRTPDGHYLVAGGYVAPGSSAVSIAVAFHKSDLTLDTSLGNQGIAIVPNTVVYSIGTTFEAGLRAVPTLDVAIHYRCGHRKLHGQLRS
ncbi:MAG: hypothetical protein FWD69_07750 [Polyangiaceae bacterium]|nr:hypothetical protein [Polyangiaceae bacterium]